MNSPSENISARVLRAVRHFWQTRRRQTDKQRVTGTRDQGVRGAVTGGAQMNGFVQLFTELIAEAGIERDCIFHRQGLELPGYFRPEKQWDLLVVRENQLLVAVEAKSQVGPSFGNNFNNRTEEAMGSALDLWTAYREGVLNTTVRPWLGYVFLLEECDRSNRPVRVREPHFEVLPEFKDASYSDRYRVFCRKLVRERHYSAAAFATSPEAHGRKVTYSEPARDLSFELFVRSLVSHVQTYV